MEHSGTENEREIDITQLFDPGSEAALDAYLNLLHPTDIADLLDHVSSEHWVKITRRLPAERLADAFTHMTEHMRSELGRLMQMQRLIKVVDELETDDAADVLADLPVERSTVVLDSLTDRDEIENLLRYDEDTAGGIMQSELCRVRQDKTVAEAIEAVRAIREEIDDVLEVYTVDEHGQAKGIVALEDLVLSPNERPLAQITTPIAHRVTPDVDQEDVAQVFQKYDLVTLPVVDAAGILLGRITFDDIQDVMEEEASEDIMTMAGVSSEEELVYSSDYLKIAIFRLPWLISSLIGTMATAYLMTLFSSVPGDALVMASFVPVVMAMTGNFGSQSAMIVTRGLAIGRVQVDDVRRVFTRETAVASMIGLVSGTLVGFAVHFWKGHPMLGFAVGSAMTCSMLLASMVGVLTPMTFKRLGMDPAIAAGPLVTTGCDILGVCVYLGIAFAVLT